MLLPVTLCSLLLSVDILCSTVLVRFVGEAFGGGNATSAEFVSQLESPVIPIVVLLFGIAALLHVRTSLRPDLT